MISADEIAALGLVLQAHTAMERLTNMEVRAILEFLRGRHWLVKPQRCPCSECAPEVTP
jgi:hypothetical protein